MTAPTPDQMRALATALDAGVFRNEGLWPGEAQDVENSIAALRAAADQLEAVRRIGDHVAREYEDDPALDAMLADLTVDAAAQEDRDE